MILVLIKLEEILKYLAIRIKVRGGFVKFILTVLLIMIVQVPTYANYWDNPEIDISLLRSKSVGFEYTESFVHIRADQDYRSETGTYAKRYFDQHQYPFYFDNDKIWRARSTDKEINQIHPELGRLLKEYMEGGVFANYKNFMQKIENNPGLLGGAKVRSGYDFTEIKNCNFLTPIFDLNQYDLDLLHKVKCKATYFKQKKMRTSWVHIYRKMEIARKSDVGVVKYPIATTDSISFEEYTIYPVDRPHINQKMWLFINLGPDV